MRIGGFLVSSIFFLSLVSALRAQTTEVHVNPVGANEAVRRIEAGQSEVTNNGVFTYNYPIEIPADGGAKSTRILGEQAMARALGAPVQ
ncbi:hypothetical protein GGE07_004013 [Sinorhizobium terangae]|uniref:Uncharacterized protein n=1 Tax=Sinorhizobium terangae TaxID=110322 RepID=A0A6N7LBG5_SINTE|nr:hypothetical protein [Sinorhizobium terangae]MBB4187349.1 hypothetical protein [Sinorhizobium terangae]MQX14640.1 hypothetical protein [Sinorhizobium terangae]